MCKHYTNNEKKHFTFTLILNHDKGNKRMSMYTGALFIIIIDKILMNELIERVTLLNQIKNVEFEISARECNYISCFPHHRVECPL